MKSCRKSRICESVGRSILLLLIALFWGVAAHAEPQYTVGCDFCHTMPPGDTSAAPARDPASGFFAGNHTTHADTTQASCVKCHGTTASTDHRDGTIQIVGNINTSPATGTYTGGTAFPQSSTPVPGTCSNVNCHFETPTPTWGTAALGAASLTTCATCHPALPTTTGAHDAHLNVYGSNLATCTRCHPNHTTYDHANNAGGGTQDISLTVAYSGANFKYLPSQTGRVFGSCNSVACHSPGQGAAGGALTAGDYATPNWGTPASGSCGTCHKVTKATLTTGSHGQHLNASGAGGCVDCHTGVLGDGASYASANHFNELLDVNHGYGAGGTLGNGFGSCATALCHGAMTPVWGANTTNAACTKCHGVPTPTASYSVEKAAPGYDQLGENVAGATGTYTNGVSSDPQVGAHDTHLRGTKGYTTNLVVCTDCHAVPTNAVHADGATGFTWSDRSSRAGSLSPQYALGTCSANYCHGGSLHDGSDTSPTWNDTAYLAPYARSAANCGKCHGAPPTSDTLGTTHNGVTLAGGCASCHGHDGQGAEHIDGTLQAAGTCDSCHSYDTVGGVWGSNTHKDEPVNEGWGAHALHIDHLKTVAGQALDPAGNQYGDAAFNAVCGVCHSQNTADHMAGGRTIVLGGAAAFGPLAPAYNGLSGTSSADNPKTCSNIACHYGDSPRWQ